MTKHSDRNAMRQILAGCLEIYRRNANTVVEEAGRIIDGEVHLVLHREDCARWGELLAAACNLPTLRLASKKQIEKATIATLAEIADCDRGVPKQLADDFLHQFCGTVYEYVVERPVWGIDFEATSEPLTLGPFLLHDRRTHAVAGPHSALLAEATASFEKDAPSTWVATTVHAADEAKAIELADQQFARLEDVINCLLPACQRERRISIIYPDVAGVAPYRISSSSACSAGAESHGLLMPARADADFFRKPSTVLLRLVACAQDSSRNSDLENTLLYAARWCAQSRLTQDAATAFVQATIAIEAIFGHSAFGKGGISGRLASNTAHILGRTTQECLEIEALVAQCYRLRSEGVHGNAGTAAECLRMLPRWQDLITQVIVVLLTDNEFANLTSIEEVARILRQRPYMYKHNL